MEGSSRSSFPCLSQTNTHPPQGLSLSSPWAPPPQVFAWSPLWAHSVQVPHALQGRNANSSSLTVAATPLHLMLSSTPNSSQSERPTFSSCFSDFHRSLSLPCPTALAAIPSPLNSKTSTWVSPEIRQQRVAEGCRRWEALRSGTHRACGQ